jgi:hypothetical protein
MILLASLLVPSSRFTSCLFVEFTSYSTSESTITYFLSPMGPSSLLRDTYCNVIFFSFTKVSQTFFHINMNCTNCWNPRISKNNIHIIHINGTKIKMQHILIHSELQIFKKLNTLIVNPFTSDILCSNFQSINQLKIDKKLLGARFNRENNLFLLNASMKL